MPRNDLSGLSASFAPVHAAASAALESLYKSDEDTAVTVEPVAPVAPVATVAPVAAASVASVVPVVADTSVDNYLDNIATNPSGLVYTSKLTLNKWRECKISGPQCDTFPIVFREILLPIKVYSSTDEQHAHAIATGYTLKYVVLTDEADKVVQLFQQAIHDPSKPYLYSFIPLLRKLNYVFSAYVHIRSIPPTSAMFLADAVALSKVLCFRVPNTNKRLLIDVMFDADRERIHLYGYFLSQETIDEMTNSMLVKSPFEPHLATIPLQPSYIVLSMDLMVTCTQDAGDFTIECNLCTNAVVKVNMKFKKNIRSILYNIILHGVTIILVTKWDINIGHHIVLIGNKMGWTNSPSAPKDFTIGIDNVRSTSGILPNTPLASLEQFLPEILHSPKYVMVVDLLINKSIWNPQSYDSIYFYEGCKSIYQAIFTDIYKSSMYKRAFMAQHKYFSDAKQAKDTKELVPAVQTNYQTIGSQSTYKSSLPNMNIP